MEALLNFLPLLLLLICPISMIFMHRGHGHNSHESHHMNADEHSKHTGPEHELANLKRQTEQLKDEVATLKNLVKERA
ncbi:DUF2933 domain-containing protein [Enterococcus casseliflavus]|uniref:DUF2933 domain-containing protein n=1 Tax=Enterococcus casseliflavus TaxID=37734 RepID=UPI0023309C35|nr:DUF2933 domain-containing protein [Enterococcus casseliflavus]MDB1688208.1 DUF2933 domain-containing protein [Enterococcus casseliflavus]